ncbi:MAG: Crp/Fnr family transcriptional regulator [Chloroflexi bacterium]|jgi:CRP/FNR family transcriptional regulator, anaerobic regulatory protein|nr:Crp/Fnr family transcriptional regulator [Chloroflexota bacterium]MBT4004178.1 Crp/Fnr family transcriptional regulator [Chloroflexota bacterium]MBT4306645.1 Crp/Fnr family transcriptional regulator [Chloroflexota bacterium]MBT4533785.1 Crp/Fnr family transcriptional regulator [Chloroflexota bacterium]MBT4681569.1 Crp/Fnr family transcriptional regulator [Chloroflexota bacterium]
MITPEQFSKITNSLPFLKHADNQLISEFRDSVFMTSIPAGKDVYVEGDYPDSIALVISGVVRVYKIGHTGREITLYRFGLGESCILTVNAILSQKSFPAIATAEEDIEAVMISGDIFRDWVKRYDLWREFVFDLLSDRLSIVMTVIDEILFQRMDERIAAWLVNQSTVQNVIQVTHQEIAAELGSSREVISRILEEFKQEGLIEMSRGKINIINREGLESRSVL